MALLTQVLLLTVCLILAESTFPMHHMMHGMHGMHGMPGMHMMNPMMWMYPGMHMPGMMGYKDEDKQGVEGGEGGMNPWANIPEDKIKEMIANGEITEEMFREGVLPDGLARDHAVTDGMDVSKFKDEIPVGRVPLDRVPMDRVPLDRVPSDGVPLDRVHLDTVPSEKIPLNENPMGQGVVDQGPTGEVAGGPWQIVDAFGEVAEKVGKAILPRV